MANWKDSWVFTSPTTIKKNKKDSHTTWNWGEDTHAYLQNRIEDLGINLYSYRHLIFDKAVKNTQWKKGSLFN